MLSSLHHPLFTSMPCLASSADVKSLSARRASNCLYYRRVIVFILWVLGPSTSWGQIDTLLDLSFNERFSVLEDLINPGTGEFDSAQVMILLNNLAHAAIKKKDIAVQLEVEIVRLRVISRSRPGQSDLLFHKYRSAIALANQYDVLLQKALVLFEFAEFQWRDLEKYEIAMQYYSEAYEVARTLPDSSFSYKHRIIYILGERHYFLSDYATAVQYLKEAERIDLPEDALSSKISIHNTLALAYMSLSDNAKAEEHFKRALDVAIVLDSKGWIGNLYGNLGHVKILQGDYTEGKRLLRIDKELSLARGARGSAAGALLELANISMLAGDMRSVIRQVDSAQTLMGIRMPYERKKVLFPLLSKIYGYRGDWTKAALYLDSTLIVRDSMARKANALQHLRMQQREELQESRAEIIRAEEQDRVRMRQIYAMIIGLILALIAVLIIFRQKKKVSQARKRSDELLLNILPADVADELKATGTSQAKRYPEVTVLFSDFKNFTHHAQAMSAVELVGILDDYFKAFDQVVTALGLEKIKTVGDAYICVSGLPVPDEHHARKVVRAALAMQDVMRKSSAGWELRIGIHTGPVVAGIVGSKKFAYDIWGDTVNTAARMEQGAEAGMINISQSTYELVHKSFHCIHRGKLAAKNKGELDMYAVEQGRGE